MNKGSAIGTLPTASRTNYDFDGWYTAKTGGTKVTSSTVVNADVTYYAHWTVISEDSVEPIPTGDVLIYVAWSCALCAIGYSVYYFRKKKISESAQ